MTEQEFSFLVEGIRSHTSMNDVEEFSIEVDPRTVDDHKLMLYREAGINRLSIGIQDFNPRVQKAVNREHSVEMVGSLLTEKIRECFDSINFDVLYGLPFQTRESFRETIDNVKTLMPDRVMPAAM